VRHERDPFVLEQANRSGLASELECYLDLVKRLLFALAIGYVVLALVSRAREAVGFMTCSCYPDCWCKKPGLSLFRRVFPRFHHNPEIEAWKKRQLDPSA
jgi:hypothetical protein